jgi:hypothetical protein
MPDKSQAHSEPSQLPPLSQPAPPPPPPPEVDEALIMWIERGAAPDTEKRDSHDR